MKLPLLADSTKSGCLSWPTRVRFNSVLLPALFFTSPLITSVAPRLTWLSIALIGAALIGSALRRGWEWWELLRYRAALGAFLLFGAYVLLNSAWSTNPVAGAGKAVMILTLSIVAFAAVTAAARLEPEILSSAALAFVVGVLLGTLFILFELITDGLATRIATQWVPDLGSISPKHVRASDSGEIIALNLSKLDRNVNMALFHLWPGLLASMAFNSSLRRFALVPLFVVIAVTVAVSVHASSQVALAGSSAIVLLAWVWRDHVIRSLAVMWCAALLLVLPASFAAYQSGLHLADWLPNSTRSRVILWEYTAEKVLDRPLLGVGVASTPLLSKQQKTSGTREQPEGFVFPRTMGHHAHSLFLQSWYELGMVGALLLAVAGAAVAMLIFLLPSSSQPFACGTFAAFALVGAFAWGMWQTWFMCAVALLPIYLRVASVSVQSSVPRSGCIGSSGQSEEPRARMFRGAAQSVASQQ